MFVLLYQQINILTMSKLFNSIKQGLVRSQEKQNQLINTHSDS